MPPSRLYLIWVELQAMILLGMAQKGRGRNVPVPLVSALFVDLSGLHCGKQVVEMLMRLLELLMGLSTHHGKLGAC